MAVEDISNEILEYLKKESPINTFRLARELNIERHKLLNIIKKLEEKEAVGFRHGAVKFLKFLGEEKEVIKSEKEPTSAKPIKKVKRKAKKSKVLENLEEENKVFKEKLLELKANSEKLGGVKNKKLKEQDKIIEELRKNVRELQHKASAPPKIIRKTIIKRIPVKPKAKPKLKKVKVHKKPSKFKISKPKIVKGIQQLRINLDKFRKKLKKRIRLK